MMTTWILILVLVSPDATWTGYAYPSDANPKHFETKAQCEQWGAGMVDGDGDNEHAICASITT